MADTSGGKRIDYIFTNLWIGVTNVAILSTFRGGYFPSDHLPVIADLTIE